MRKWSEAKEFYITNGYWAGVNHPIAVARNFRRFLLETRLKQCNICARKEWNNKEIPLTMDHIDGNSNNWDQSNLRLICYNCDAQLETYKNKNRGNGRAYRRIRYANGQTY